MEYLIHIAILASIYSILAISLNLVVGFAGMLSVTHAVFFGLGAYTTAILTTSYNINFFLSIIVGVFVALFVSKLIGVVLSRFRGDYVALASLGFNIIVWSMFLNLQDLTRGPLGIPGIKRPELFGINFNENLLYLILCIIFVFLIYKLSEFIANSSFGRVLKAIREDENVLQVFGYSTPIFKLTIFSISAGMASIAGSLFASYISFIDPSSFILSESVFMISAIILGGLGSLRGSVIGMTVLIILPEALRFVGFSPDIAAQMRLATYGLLLIILMIYRPKGFIGEYKI